MSEIAKALAALQAALPVVPKSKTATVRSDKGNYSYTYADLAEIAPLIYPLLSRNGLSFTSYPTLNGEGRFVLGYELLHVSGESREGQYPLPDPVSQKPQNVGSAITYARRYCLGAATGLVTEEDDDAQASSVSKPKAPPREPGTTRTVRRAQPPDPQPEPETDSGITDAQMHKLQALLKQKGLTSRDLALAFVGDALGRDVASSKDLTKGEASKVIDALDKEPDH